MDPAGSFTDDMVLLTFWLHFCSFTTKPNSKTQRLNCAKRHVYFGRASGTLDLPTLAWSWEQKLGAWPAPGKQMFGSCSSSWSREACIPILWSSSWFVRISKDNDQLSQLWSEGKCMNCLPCRDSLISVHNMVLPWKLSSTWLNNWMYSESSLHCTVL